MNEITLSMQAQIAMANTALTTLGMWILQIPGIGLLGLFVFICSFIPIAGVFISTVPIAFVALTEYGFVKVPSAPACCPWLLPLAPSVVALPAYRLWLPATNCLCPSSLLPLLACHLLLLPFQPIAFACLPPFASALPAPLPQCTTRRLSMVLLPFAPVSMYVSFGLMPSLFLTLPCIFPGVVHCECASG